MKKLLAVLVLSGLAGIVNAEKPSVESIEKLMQVTKADQMAEQMWVQMSSMLKSKTSDAPKDFWQKIEKEKNIKEVIQLLIPVYQKHLSQKDIDAILVFYQSPAGQRLIAAQPKIMQESMVIGQQWGENLTKKIMAEYKAEKEKIAEKEK